MQLRTKIGASAAAASAIVLAMALRFTLHDDGSVRGSYDAPAPVASPSVRPIAADPSTVAAGRDAQVDALFSSLERDGPAAPVYVAMRDEFPQRYSEMKRAMRAEMSSGTGGAAPARRIADLTRESLDGFKDLVRQSSDEGLRKVAAAQYSLLTVLSRRAPDACARYAAQGGDTDMPQDPETSTALMALATAQIHAAGDAARSPHRRQPPDKTVFAALVQRMRGDGITDQQIYLLGDGRLSGLPVDQQCGVAASMYRSALALPPEDAGTLLAAIIRN
jgi:hypothetical protein